MGHTGSGYTDIGKSSDGENFLSDRQIMISGTDRIRAVLMGRKAPVINMINNNQIKITGVD